MKTAGIFLIAAGILSAGREWENRKRACVHELEYFYRFLQFLEQEVVYRQTKLPAALTRFDAYAKGSSAVFAAQLARKLQTRQEAVGLLWEETVRQVYAGLGLDGEELRIIGQAGNAFSLWQKEMIGEQAKLDRQCLQKLWQEREAQLQKDCRLFRCLSVTASLFAVIVLI